MKAQVKVQGARIAIEVEASGIKELFEKVARVDEVFNAEPQCGLCGNMDTRFSFRVVKGYNYYEMACHCGAQLSFGQHKEGGGLWPKLHDKNGKPLPNYGWTKFREEPPE